VRRPIYGIEVGETAEELVRQGPPWDVGHGVWTLRHLAEAIAARFSHIARMSLETVRRLLWQRGISYRQAKEWLTSPDPHYERRKRRRDRLVVMARMAPDGAAVWLDQSWFVRWPYQYRKWATQDDLPRVPKRWNEKVETTALYATLDDESQEAFLSWADGQPNSEETIAFLAALMAHWTEKGKRFIVLVWDQASWHTSKRTRAWIQAYNQRAKRNNWTRLIVCGLPTRSPWLMPLESIFGWIKHRVLAGQRFESVRALQSIVERYFRERVDDAKVRRDKAWATAMPLLPKSRSVL
jgi:hypothetical protein